MEKEESSTERSQKQNFSQFRRSPGDFVKGICFLNNVSFKYSPLLGVSEAVCRIKHQNISRTFFSSFAN